MTDLEKWVTILQLLTGVLVVHVWYLHVMLIKLMKRVVVQDDAITCIVGHLCTDENRPEADIGAFIQKIRENSKDA